MLWVKFFQAIKSIEIRLRRYMFISIQMAVYLFGLSIFKIYTTSDNGKEFSFDKLNNKDQYQNH
jgi:hypothetical protein